MTDQPDNLSLLRDYIWQRLQTATLDFTSPWRFAALATLAGTDEASAAHPNLRTIVIRSLDRESGTLTFYTDKRSQKIQELSDQPATSLLFWDPIAHEQLRVYGQARNVGEQMRLDHAWEALPLGSRKDYLMQGPSGEEIAGPSLAYESELNFRRITEQDSQPGRANFAIVDITCERWDWLSVTGAVHRRAKFDGFADAPQSARWVMP